MQIDDGYDDEETCYIDVFFFMYGPVKKTTLPDGMHKLYPRVVVIYSLRMQQAA